MTIVTSTYRYKRPPRKRKPNPGALAMPRIVTAKKPKRGKEVLGHRSDSTTGAPKARPAIITIPRKRGARFGDAPDMTEEEHRRRGDAADALWREIVRAATGKRPAARKANP